MLSINDQQSPSDCPRSTINDQQSPSDCPLSLGLLGYPLSHSFSKGWFEARGHSYRNFEYPTVEEFMTALPSDLDGFSVTIPHKQSIIDHLDDVDEAVVEIGAVNCVKITALGLRGYNTDYIGFESTLRPLLTNDCRRAAILGSGGASRAVQYVMRRLKIDYVVLSRSNGLYECFDPSDYQIIVNTTPLGMYPSIDDAPAIDYHRITPNSICYDLVYNPAQTEFLRRCRRQGAVVVNGLSMLYAQAEAALEIFTSPTIAHTNDATLRSHCEAR